MAKPSLPAGTLDLMRGMFEARALNDGKIAEALGVSRSAVFRHRKAMGYPPTDKRFYPTPRQLEDLRTTSDREMVARHGGGKETWAKVRKEHGIPGWREINKPAPKVKAIKAPGSTGEWGFWRAPDPKRDSSLAGEAAAYLRGQRFPNVFDRAKLEMGTGWQVGRSVLSVTDMVAKACRLGFKPEPWMGEVA